MEQSANSHPTVASDIPPADVHVPVSVREMRELPALSINQHSIVVNRILGRVKSLLEAVVPGGPQCAAAKKQATLAVWFDGEKVERYAMEYAEAATSGTTEWRPGFHLDAPPTTPESFS